VNWPVGAPLQPRLIDLGGEPFAYLEAGPAHGPLVVCLHGFPDDARTFEGLMERLAAAGYRVVAPWLRGYAPSTLRGSVAMDQLVADVRALIDRLAPTGPVRLVGHDWGGGITYATTALRPERIVSAVTLAIPHPAAVLADLPTVPRQLGLSWYMFFFQLPGLPQWVVARQGGAFVGRLWRAWSPGFTPDPSRLAQVRATIVESLPRPIDYYRANARTTPEGLRWVRELASPSRRIHVPTLHLLGADDGCLDPRTGASEARYFAGPFVREVVPGAGHFVHLERPDHVADRVLHWFAQG
jgi:pimeloyl-ACP methyl ester carboxylesterase